jgi:1-acyl-sn-glycerol-3-phosphate acyltransferase
MVPESISPLWYGLNFCWVWTVFTLGFSLRTQGHQHVPRRGPVLFLANHESFLDPLAVGLAVRRQTRYLARKTLFRNRTFGAFLRSVGCVPVDQEGVAKEGLKVSLELLQAGQALLVFPEGGRTFTGEMAPFKPGVLLLMKKASVPIVPVGVAGAYEAYPRGQLLPHLAPLFWPATGNSLAVSVGEPLPPERFVGMQREEILKLLFDQVKAQVERADRLCRDKKATGSSGEPKRRDGSQDR